MWKQEEPIQTVTPRVTSTTGSARPAARSAGPQVKIGKSIVVRGELHGGEDLTIEGQVEGEITLAQHVLTVGTHGRIRAHVFAKSVVVRGEVVGDIEATERVSISAEATVDGDIRAPRVAIAEGARFHGGIDMHQGQQADHAGSDSKPASEADRSAPAVKARDTRPPAVQPGVAPTAAKRPPE